MQNKNNTPYALTPILQIRFVAILYNYQKKKKTFQVLHKLFQNLTKITTTTAITTTITTTTLYCICKTANYTYKTHSIFVRWIKVNLKANNYTENETKNIITKKTLNKRRKVRA